MTRLKRVRRDELTIERRRSGRGYVYLDADGKRVSEAETIQRIRQLRIPPAWTGVKIAAYPRAHLQAYGHDADGRVQYIYHPEWAARRAKRRQQQLSKLTAALPRLRRRLAVDLSAEAGTRELALALGVALIDRTAMRVGRERYLVARGTRGAGTLFSRDVTVRGDVVQIQFPAKSGKHASYALKDAQLAEAILRIKTIRGLRLLMYRDDSGEARVLRTEELNAYIRDISGADVTAKDFRTLHASALAGEALAKLEPAPSAAGRKRQVTSVTRQVASFLQNTPVICRQSYIAPCLFKLFDDGELAQLWISCSDRRDGLRQREVRLGAVLNAAG